MVSNLQFSLGFKRIYRHFSSKSIIAISKNINKKQRYVDLTIPILLGYIVAVAMCSSQYFTKSGNNNTAPYFAYSSTNYNYFGNIIVTRSKKINLYGDNILICVKSSRACYFMHIGNLLSECIHREKYLSHAGYFTLVSRKSYMQLYF